MQWFKEMFLRQLLHSHNKLCKLSFEYLDLKFLQNNVEEEKQIEFEIYVFEMHSMSLLFTPKWDHAGKLLYPDLQH
jgi:hypothetical protein